ncbi:hypothetical protein L0F63_006176, partial [Massospora cicadina]
MLGGLMLVFQTLFSRGKLQLAMIRTFFFGLYSFGSLRSGATSHGEPPRASPLRIPLGSRLRNWPSRYTSLPTPGMSWASHRDPLLGVVFSCLRRRSNPHFVFPDWLGPRWLVPAFLLPPTYNYHPILARTNEEEPLDPSHKDCAICMLSLLEPDSSDPSTPLLHPQTTTYRSSATMSLARFSSSRGLMVAHASITSTPRALT